MSALPDQGRATLELEQLLLDPTMASYLAHHSARLSDNGYADQVQAATDAVRYMHASLPTPTGAVPGWLRLCLLREYVNWCFGTARTCMHSPDIRYPQPTFCAAWRPGLVVCAHCAQLLALPKDSVPDRTCDACGTVTSFDPKDPLYSSIINLGPFGMVFAVCTNCREEMPETFKTKVPPRRKRHPKTGRPT